MIKSIFFDIDGTLASFKTHQITPGIRDALERARARGIKLFVATGRHASVMGKGSVLEGIPFDGYISLNGQYCYNSSGILYKNAIHKDDIASLLEELRRDPFSCCFIEAQKMYMNFVSDLALAANRSVGIVPPPVCDISRAQEHDIYQMLFFVSAQREPEIMARLPHCDTTRWSPLFADIVPKGGSKYIGAAKLLEHYGLLPEEAMAFGDGENDIALLQGVGLGVAMGNASPPVKACADFVGPSVDEDGIRHVLEHFHVI